MVIITLSSPADNMFPYLSIIISMISNAFFLAIRLDQTMLSLIIVCTLDLKNAIIIRKPNTFFPVSFNGLPVLTFCPSMWFLSLFLSTSPSWPLAGAGLRNNCPAVPHLVAAVRAVARPLLRHHGKVHRSRRVLGGEGQTRQLIENPSGCPSFEPLHQCTPFEPC